jgi:hypothetical protein
MVVPDGRSLIDLKMLWKCGPQQVTAAESQRPAAPQRSNVSITVIAPTIHRSRDHPASRMRSGSHPGTRLVEVRPIGTEKSASARSFVDFREARFRPTSELPTNQELRSWTDCRLHFMRRTINVPSGYALACCTLDDRIPTGARYALNERHSDKTASRILAAYRCDIVEATKRNPIVKPEKKNLKHLESEQNHLDFAICGEMRLCHSRSLTPL